MVALRLAKSNWASGDPDRILEMSADKVINMLHYEVFLKEYDDTFQEINKDHGK